MLSLLILAAGESSRMGSPKALLKIGNETFLQCIIRKGREAGLQSILVITGRDHDQIAGNRIVSVKNENYRRGQISSLQAGIRALPEDVDAIVVWPVDQPLIKTETLRQLISFYETARKAIVVPIFQNRRGHPVIYSREAMQWALNLEVGQTGRDLQNEHANDRVQVEVEDPGIVIDIDTPEDYSKYITT
jgi:molybdenum cofactor cytidylyltransferase